MLRQNALAVRLPLAEGYSLNPSDHSAGQGEAADAGKEIKMANNRVHDYRPSAALRAGA